MQQLALLCAEPGLKFDFGQNIGTEWTWAAKKSFRDDIV
jgi:hypothetical protein